MTREPSRLDDDAVAMFARGGTLGARMAALDWSTTSFGPISTWSASFRSALSICLGSPFPIALYWGPTFSLVYNDAWAPILGDKNATSLAQPGAQVWPELWPEIGSMFEQVRDVGASFFRKNDLLPMHRRGYTEECYFDYSLSPVRGEGGVIEGVFNAVSETTFQLIAERRSRALRELSLRLRSAGSAVDAIDVALDVFAAAGNDVAWAVVVDGDRVGGAVNVDLGAGVDLDALRAGKLPLPARRPAWPEPVVEVLVASVGADRSLVVGANPRRRVDDEYVQFVNAAAGLVARGVADAEERAHERRRAEEVAALDRAKTQFFHNVSHELRTPLTLMLGPVKDAVEAGGALAGEDLVVVERSGDRLLRLVNTLLEVSRLEAKQGDVSFARVDVGVLTAELAAGFRSLTDKAGLILDVDCPPLRRLPLVDVEAWEKIVLNLMSNAYKFTLQGRIGVSVREDGDDVVLVVEDSGAGIPADDVAKLFQRFHRVARQSGRSIEGSGIGLALVKELVVAHGGVVDVSSVAGEGSRFTVRIPIERAGVSETPLPTTRTSTKAASMSLLQEASSWTSLMKEATPPTSKALPRVLVVDDNADLRAYVQRILREGHEVLVAKDGEEALEILRERPVDLVVSDVMMPRLDGTGLLAALRADRAYDGVPVLLLSARSEQTTKATSLLAGADDHLAKPFRATELVARVSSLLARSAATKAAAAREQRSVEAFLAMLAHELRNPLSPVRSAVHLLADEVLSAEARSYVDVIDRQTTNLARIVDDLLDVSRVTRGLLELKREVIDTRAVVTSSVTAVRALTTQKKQRISVDVGAEPLWADVDRVRLEQVLVNLLTNAAKYSDDGGAISVVARSDGDRVVFAVADDGIGIPANELDQIFTLFHQEERGLERARGGLGIGLTVVKALVEQHGGTIVAESAGRGHGTTMTVTLPLASAPAQTTTQAAPPTKTGALRLLVVDDNRDHAEILHELLSIWGHDVVVAHDGEEAARLLVEREFDVALLDIGLPGKDGYQIAAAQKATTTTTKPVLVALTGYGAPRDRQRAIDAGFDHHLVKPPDIAALGQLLTTVSAARSR